MTALEDLQQVDQKVVFVLGLLTQADQALEEVHAYAQRYQEGNPNPKELVEALKDIRVEIGKVTARHNELQGQIREAQHEVEQQQANQANDPGF